MRTKALLVILFTVIITISCTTGYYTRKGVYNYDLLRYKKASEYFEKAIDKNNPHPSSYNYLVKSYLKLRDYDKIAEFGKKHKDVVLSNENIAIDYSRSLVLTSTDSLPVSELTIIQEKHPSCKEINNIITNAADSSFFDVSRDFTIYPLKIDDLDAVFSPSLHNGDLYFTGLKFNDKTKKTWDGNSYTGLYYTTNRYETDTSLVAPLKVEQLSSDFNLGTLVVDSVRGNYIFSANQPTPKNIFFLKNKVVDLNLAIYSVPIDSDEEPEFLNFVNKNYSYMHPALSNSGNVLFFASDMPGGFGGYDIYYSEFTGTEWSMPRNAGSAVNTSGDEVFPYAINSKLFFSSDNHYGMGGLDIFVCDIEKVGVFSNLVNLNSPFNSKYDDFGVLINDSINKGFFSSNRSGSDNIYAIKIQQKEIVEDTVSLDTIITLEHEKPLMFIRLYVKYKENSEPVPYAVIVKDEKDFLQADEHGFFMFQIEEKKEYVFTVEQEGFYKLRSELKSPEAIGKDTIFVDETFYLEEIVIEKVIVLENIYYDYNKWDIRPDAELELNKLVQLLKDNPSIELELSSHTDSRGNDDYNMLLSKRRAESAVKYIYSQGIDSTRIVANYYGESKLLNHCSNGVQCPEELHQQNRRTEIKVTKINEDNTKVVYSSKYFDYLAQIAEQSSNSNNINIENSSFENNIVATEDGKMWHIVAGSYKYIENARVYEAQMRESGYADVKILIEPSGKFYRVTIESFTNLASAIKSIKILKSETGDEKLWLLYE